MKRAIYIGAPTKRIGPRGSELYLGYGMTGEVIMPGETCHLFRSDDGNEWYVAVGDLYYGANT
jgi:hypothetical protein